MTGRWEPDGEELVALLVRARRTAACVVGDEAAADIAAPAVVGVLARRRRDAPRPDGPNRSDPQRRVTAAAARRAVAHLRRHPPPAPPVPVPFADAVLARLAVTGPLAALPGAQSEALVLRLLVGLDEAEVAAAMDLPPEAVGDHLRRALASVRRVTDAERAASSARADPIDAAAGLDGKGAGRGLDDPIGAAERADAARRLPALRAAAVRSRRRRRALPAGAVAVAFVALAATGIALGGAHTLRRIVASGRVPGRASGPAPSAGSVHLRGEWVPTAAAFASPTTGVLSVTGTAGGAAPPDLAWSERTVDGGAEWTAGPVVPAASGGAVSADTLFVGDDGWAWGGRLYATTDTGRTWTAELPGWTVTAVGAVPGSTWLLAQRAGAPCAAAACPETVFATTGPGAPLHPLPTEPVARPSAFEQFVHPSASIGEVVVAGPDGATTLETTTDGGRHWERDPSPCAAPATETALAPLGAAQLWATCFVSAGHSDSTLGLVVVERSSDDGRSWRRVTPATASVHDTAGQIGDYDSAPVGASPILQVSSPSVAWAVGLDPGGVTSLWRTGDGGATWTRVLHDPGRLTLDGFTALSATTAVVGADDYTGADATPYVARTTDGGRTWSVAALPAPPSIPRDG